MVSFKELSKPIDEILDKQFVHGKPWSVDLRHKLDNPILKHSAQMSNDGRLSCASSTGLDFGRGKVTGFIGLDGSGGLQMTYNTDMGLTFQSNVTSAHQGTSSLLGMDQFGCRNGATNANAGREQKVDLQLKYRGDPWHLHASVNPLSKKWSVATVARYPMLGGASVAAGVDVSGSALAPPTLSGGALAYTFPTRGHSVTGCISVAPYGEYPLGQVSVAVASQQTNNSEMAARYTYIPSTDKTELCLGGGWIIDPKTKLTSLKVKIDQDATLAAALTHKVNPNASLTIGAAFKASGKVGKGSNNPVDLGIKLNLTA